MFGRNSGMVEGHSDHAVQPEDAGQIWTCAMHPQVRQHAPGQCPICGMDLIPLNSVAASGNPLTLEMTPEAVKLASIRTVEAGSGSGPGTRTVSLTGKIQVDERRISSQVVHVPGRIEQLFVTFTGEQVRPGQKLAILYSPELVSAQRELIEAAKWKKTNPQLLEAARTKLRYWKISDTTIAQVEESGEIQQNITVYAEHAGIVRNRRVAVGDYVREGSVLFDIVDLNQVWALFDAYEEDLGSIRVGDVVSFTLQALPGKTFKARITFIDPVINPQTRVASLRAEVANSAGVLKPEMLLNGMIESSVAKAKGTLTVPKTAVLWTGTRSVVYVEVPGATVPSFEFREVTIGDAMGFEYSILSGLEAGERVVVNGAFVIDAAAQLNNMSSMMNRNVKQTGMQKMARDYSAEVTDEFRSQLMRVVHRYMPLKDALVSTDVRAAKAEAGALNSALDNVEMELLQGEGHMYWMKEQAAMKSHVNGISSSDDIEEQRKQFSFLTNVLVDALTAFGTGQDTLYLQYCPMAFDNAGADWLSEDETIRNPYFGDKMLKCGSVKTTFPLEKRQVSSQVNPIHQH